MMTWKIIHRQRILPTSNQEYDDDDDDLDDLDVVDDDHDHENFRKNIQCRLEG